MKWLLTRLQYVWRRHGISGLTPLLIHNIADYTRHLRNYTVSKGKVVDPFDQQYGIDTSGLVSLNSLDMLQHPNAVYAGPYGPSSVPQVRALIEKLDIEIDRFIFIDYGSGKGRVLLVAAQFPFREVIGVEFSRQLHEIALRNIAQFPADQLHCRSIRSTLEDATAFVLPPSDLVCYFYNPFGVEVLTGVVRRLAAHAGNGYRVIVIYVKADHREVFDQSGVFTVMAESPKEKWLPGAVVLTTRYANLSPQSDGEPRDAGRL
jgi:hypothetical protein